MPSRQFALLTTPGGSAPSLRDIRIDDAPVVKVPCGGQFPDQMADAGRSAIITEFPAIPTDQAERTALLERAGPHRVTPNTSRYTLRWPPAPGGYLSRYLR